jgi:inosose dehydratase
MNVAFNPLPWYFGADGWHQPVGVTTRSVYEQIRSTGFGAVPVDLPEGTTVTEYRALLDETGLEPAPGYLQIPLAAAAHLAASLEQARRTAAVHAELGVDHLFVADEFGPPERVACPAVGAAASDERVAVMADVLGAVADAVRSEGVHACLHPHVGTWVETEAETMAVLDAVAPELLLFGPDVGHLAWAGADYVGLLDRYRDRVGAVHLKDVRRPVREACLDARLPYLECASRHVFTEPGRGDLDLAAVVTALDGFAGWWVVEVDVPDQPSPLETARVCADWVRHHLPPGGGTR